MTFKDLGLDDNIVRSVTELGFEKPSEIQEKAIPQLLTSDTDLVGLAQTGTGKTAAFGLPMIQKIDPTYRAIQGLILCPTRELCLQITKEITAYSKYSDGVKVTAVYGGASITDQIRDIKKGANIIVGTPGRTIDLMQRKVLKFDTVSTVVLDEADEMLNMGFKEDINEILEGTPAFKRTWLFSATMPKEVERIASNYMTDPFKVTVGTKNSSAANIEHQYCLVSGRDQYNALRRFIDYSPGMFGIVFTRTRREAKEFAEKLMTDGYNADALHGDLSQAQRDAVMNKFRCRALQILIATDVAARGIDVDDVTHVFHVDLPDEIESYTHRSGRTARAGKSGVSVALISPSKSGRIRLVEKQIGKKLDLVKAPTGTDICGQQIIQLTQNVHDVEVNEKGIAPFVAQIHESLADFTKEEIIERFVSVEFNKFLQTYDNAKDINIDPSRQRRGSDRDEGGRRGRSDNSVSNTNRLFINVGKMDGFENKGQILGFICNQSGIDGNSVGKIDLFDSFAFIGVEDGVGERIISNMNGKNIESRDIRVEFSKDKPRGERGGGRRSEGGGERRRRDGGGDRSGRRRDGGDRKEFSRGGGRNDRSRSRR
ncbi:MAG: DEAD/DEAH box helicase [Flavobacteriales bacterium]|nr:DEAD/DEAH box helicase [Flavobacteriales bacterium]MCB9363107.1 DEAD/DEAH box helicase [Flavobacteriales bacterium]